MRPIYATRFTLQNRADESLPDFEVVRDHISGWITGKYQSRYGVPELELPFDSTILCPMSGHELSTNEERVGEGRMAEVLWLEPDREYDKRVWQTSVTLATDEYSLEFGILVRAGSPTFSVEPVGPIRSGPPNIVRQLVEQYICKVAVVEIASKRMIVDEAHVDLLVKFILSPSRSLPIVLISQASTRDTVVRATDVQRKLMGLAHVWEIGYEASRRLTTLLGKSSSCFEGAVRVYWPGFRRESQVRHPLYLADRIRDSESRGFTLENELFKSLAGIAASQYGDGPVLRGLRSRAEKKRRDEIRQLRTLVKEAQENPAKADDKAWLQEFSDTLDQNEALSSNVEALTQKVGLLEAELAQTKQNMLVIQQYQEGSSDIGDAIDDATLPPPTSIREAVSRAAESFPILEIWPSAYDSADRSSSSKTEDVFGVFEVVASLANEYKSKNGAVGPWDGYFEPHGLNYARGESEHTMNLYGNERKFSNGSAEVTIEKHITIAKNNPSDCVQIYFDVIDNDRFVVAYCGQHLPTSKSTF